jgi:hypothetical protein
MGCWALEKFVQILPESGSALDPDPGVDSDPHSSKMLDPYVINADPKHWTQLG